MGVYSRALFLSLMSGSRALAITSASSVSNTTGTTLLHNLTATRPVTWSIVGGADQAAFELSGAVLRWAANGTQNVAAPADSDLNNTYIVTVRATNASGSTVDQTITVTVVSAVVLAPAFLLEDGTSKILLEDGTSFLILE